MAGENAPQPDNIPGAKTISKVILRFGVMEGGNANLQGAQSAMNSAARKLQEKTMGRIAVAPAENDGVFVEVAGSENLYSTLADVAAEADTAITDKGVAYELTGARMSTDTYDVSPPAAWRNLSLNPATDATEEALAIVEQQRSAAWEDCFVSLNFAAE